MLSILETYHIHFFSSLLLLVIFVLNKLKKDVPTFSIRLFHAIIFVNLLLLILEPLSFIADANTASYLPYLNYAIDILMIILTPLLVGLWASYIDYKFFKQQKRVKKRLYYQHITLLSALGIIINFFTPIFFSIDFTTNTYERGYLFVLKYVFVFSIYFYVAFMIFKNRKRQKSRVIMGILLFLLFPILGSIIQVFYQTLYFQYTGAALGVLIIFIFLETTSGNKDYLTNLYSRRVLDEHLDGIVDRDIGFSIVMIDLNRFKEINDIHGHLAGDRLLVEFAKIIQNARQSSRSLIARLGGDEFLCILVEEDHKNVEQYIKNIDEGLKNSMISNKYENIGYSKGFLPFDPRVSVSELLKKVDALMYENKKAQNKKN